METLSVDDTKNYFRFSTTFCEFQRLKSNISHLIFAILAWQQIIPVTLVGNNPNISWHDKTLYIKKKVFEGRQKTIFEFSLKLNYFRKTVEEKIVARNGIGCTRSQN